MGNASNVRRALAKLRPAIGSSLCRHECALPTVWMDVGLSFSPSLRASLPIPFCASHQGGRGQGGERRDGAGACGREGRRRGLLAARELCRDMATTRSVAPLPRAHCAASMRPLRRSHAPIALPPLPFPPLPSLPRPHPRLRPFAPLSLCPFPTRQQRASPGWRRRTTCTCGGWRTACRSPAFTSAARRTGRRSGPTTRRAWPARSRTRSRSTTATTRARGSSSASAWKASRCCGPRPARRRTSLPRSRPRRRCAGPLDPCACAHTSFSRARAPCGAEEGAGGAGERAHLQLRCAAGARLTKDVLQG